MLRRTALPLMSVIRQRGDPALNEVMPPIPDAALQYPDEPCISKYPLVVPPPETERVSKPAPRHVSVNDMLQDMHDVLGDFRRKNGFGRAIAANQLGYRARAIAMRTEEESALSLLNPQFVEKSDNTFTLWDDCFSFPGSLVRVKRHMSGTVKFTTPDGDVEEWIFLDSKTCELLQHEIDHLDGKLSFERACPVEVPPDSPLLQFADRIKLDENGCVSELPRDVYEKCKHACQTLVWPRHRPFRVW